MHSCMAWPMRYDEGAHSLVARSISQAPLSSCEKACSSTLKQNSPMLVIAKDQILSETQKKSPMLVIAKDRVGPKMATAELPLPTCKAFKPLVLPNIGGRKTEEKVRNIKDLWGVVFMLKQPHFKQSSKSTKDKSTVLLKQAGCDQPMILKNNLF